MSSVKLLILVAALAVITDARVALLPGWVVPAPVVLLAVVLAVVGALAALVALRLLAPRIVPAPRRSPAPAGPRVITGKAVAR